MLKVKIREEVNKVKEVKKYTYLTIDDEIKIADFIADKCDLSEAINIRMFIPYNQYSYEDRLWVKQKDGITEIDFMNFYYCHIEDIVEGAPIYFRYVLDDNRKEKVGGCIANDNVEIMGEVCVSKFPKGEFDSELTLCIEIEKSQENEVVLSDDILQFLNEIQRNTDTVRLEYDKEIVIKKGVPYKHRERLVVWYGDEEGFEEYVADVVTTEKGVEKIYKFYQKVRRYFTREVHEFQLVEEDIKIDRGIKVFYLNKFSYVTSKLITSEEVYIQRDYSGNILGLGEYKCAGDWEDTEFKCAYCYYKGNDRNRKRYKVVLSSHKLTKRDISVITYNLDKYHVIISVEEDRQNISIRYFEVGKDYEVQLFPNRCRCNFSGSVDKNISLNRTTTEIKSQIDMTTVLPKVILQYRNITRGRLGEILKNIDTVVAEKVNELFEDEKRKILDSCKNLHCGML